MFSASEAAFSGFRAGREHFRTLLVWIPILALLAFGMVAIMVVMAGPNMAAMAAAGYEAETDPQAALAAMAPLFRMYAVLFPYMLVYYAVLHAAVNRLMLRPSDKRLAYFALGADELRQLALMILMTLVFFGVYLLGVIGIVIEAGLLTAISKSLAPLGLTIGFIVLISVMVVLAVRLSLASAQTFATRRINLFGSWALTRGQFWPMLGAYVLAIILAIITYTAVFAILALIAVLVGGGFGVMGRIFQPDFTSLKTLYTPTYLIWQLGVALPAPFMLLITLCPAPEIYRSLVAGKTA